MISSLEEMAVTGTCVNEEMALQLTGEKERHLTKKSTSFPQSLNGTEGAESLLRKITRMDPILDSPGDKDTTSPEADLLPEVDTKERERLHQGAEPGQGLWSEQDEHEGDLDHNGPHVTSSPWVLERNTPELSQESAFPRLSYWSSKMGLRARELGADHLDWMEKIHNIMQKINTSESTMRSLLSEVTSLEDQTENLDDDNQGENIEMKIMEIKKQLKEMNNQLAQVDACNEAHELKERLLERIKNFYKEMNLLNSKLGLYHMEDGETDSDSSEETGPQEAEPLLPDASVPPSGLGRTLQSTLWKRALRLFAVLCVVSVTGLSCYFLFVDATFIFERLLPSMLGHRAVWGFREMIMPSLKLEVEDLLPS
uniref:single-pass membrane and coiled-coil domain-containing protein 2 n=1 Tax=Jaculus jaculus TaxID=51337 RepID=UPI001E1AF7AF|nr:single-pass membrane and coiled-coil domain-containing protein 2 [Jaculus jaculus]